jgi:hypothetical protein
MAWTGKVSETTRCSDNPQNGRRGVASGKRFKLRGVTHTLPEGLRVQWSPTNRAWIVIWNEAEQRIIGDRNELADYLMELGARELNPKPSDRGTALMARKKSKKKKSRPAHGVPRRKKDEPAVTYHDRLAALIAETDKAGDDALSERLQIKAGVLAKKHPDVAKKPRKNGPPRSGPGTYPWYQCVDEQTNRGKGKPHHMPHDQAKDRANQICGRIRANSRSKYPTYWNIREGRANPESEGIPYAGIALDGGPRSKPHRDLVVIVDREGGILDLCPILGEHGLDQIDRQYPGLPIFGPFQVLVSNIRELYRTAERGTPRVEVKK